VGWLLIDEIADREDRLLEYAPAGAVEDPAVRLEARRLVEREERLANQRAFPSCYERCPVCSGGLGCPECVGTGFVTRFRAGELSAA
jgi:hypothetical protein